MTTAYNDLERVRDDLKAAIARAKDEAQEPPTREDGEAIRRLESVLQNVELNLSSWYPRPGHTG